MRQFFTKLWEIYEIQDKRICFRAKYQIQLILHNHQMLFWFNPNFLVRNSPNTEHDARYSIEMTQILTIFVINSTSLWRKSWIHSKRKHTSARIVLDSQKEMEKCAIFSKIFERLHFRSENHWGNDAWRAGHRLKSLRMLATVKLSIVFSFIEHCI